MFRHIARQGLVALSKLLPFDIAIQASRQLLAAQGFGSGACLKTSGEAAVFRLVQGSAPVLFDVGGYLGEYTRLFLAAKPDGRAFVFEPSDSHLCLLRKNLAGCKNVEILPFGLGSEAARLPLYKNCGVSGLASLSQRRLDHYNITMEQMETVEIRSLDAVIEEKRIGTIDLLKIDVEGHELEVLKGASRCFEHDRIKLVQFEFGGCNLDTRTTLQDFFYFFKQHGMSVAIVAPSARVHHLSHYDEFFEHYCTTNFVAGPVSIFQ